MKLLWITLACLAIALAEDVVSKDKIADTEAEASENIEIVRTGSESLDPAASTYQSNYIPPSQRPQRPWNQNQGYVPPQSSYIPPQNNYVPPQNNYVPPQNNYVPPQNNYNPPQNVPSYVPQNIPAPPQSNYVSPPANPAPPQSNYVSPPANPAPPQSGYVPQNDFVAPQSDPIPPQNSWNQPQNNNWNQQQQNNNWNQQQTWNPPQPAAPTTTTPATVIKDEQIHYPDGSYRYEYQIANGQWVSEEGYIKNRNTDNEIPVKKGWYSYPGADGRIYTVTYWADETGYHASGDHLPTPPPTPAAIQTALDQAAEAEKNKQNQYPQQQPATPAYYPQQQQPSYPAQQTYPQQTYPQQSYPSYSGK